MQALVAKSQSMIFHEDRGMMKLHFNFILTVVSDLAINHHINLAMFFQDLIHCKGKLSCTP